MKKSILPILVLMLVLPYLATAQGVDGVKPARNSIVITPLGDLLNNSKSSIYYRRVLKSNSNKYLSLRLGTELFNSIKNEFSSGREEQSKSSNFKWGLEMGKEMDRMMVYFGPEMSYTVSKIEDATLFPNEDAIFSTESIIAEEWDIVDETKMSLFSMIGYVGFKYKLTNSLLLGVESAVGIGWYRSNHGYDSNVFAPKREFHKGVIRDLSVNRFVLLEYRF